MAERIYAGGKQRDYLCRELIVRFYSTSGNGFTINATGASLESSAVVLLVKGMSNIKTKP
jgi:hypothetical protein